MFTSLGRVAARRVVLNRTASPQLLQLSAKPLVLRPAPIARSFAVSARAWSPATKASAPKKQAAKATGSKAGRKPGSKNKPKPETKTKKAATEAKKPKKVKLSPEEADKATVRELRKLALQDPEALPHSTWAQFLSDRLKEGNSNKSTFGDIASAASSEWRSLPKSELDRYEATAEANRKKNAEIYRAWIETHSPAAIFVANRARRHLRKNYGKKLTSRTRTLKDDRIPKLAGTTAFAQFVSARFHTLGVTDLDRSARFAEIGSHWRAMSDAEKQPFFDIAAMHKKEVEPKVEQLREEARLYWKEQTTLSWDYRRPPVADVESS